MTKKFIMAKFSFHLFIYTVYICAWYHNIDLTLYVEMPPVWKMYGGPFKFITNWYLLVQTITTLLTLLSELMATESCRVTRIRNLLFNSVCFPLGVFITTGFWSIFLMDTGLVWEPGMDKVNPFLKNHVLHTLPIVVVLLDSFLIDHNRRQETHGLKVLWTMITCYAVYVTFLGYYLNVWVYPYLSDLSHLMRFGFLVIHYALPTLNYYISGLLYDLINYSRINKSS